MSQKQKKAPQPEDMAIRFARALAQDGRYPPAAYEFLQRGLAYTAQRLHGSPGSGADRARHISGRQLCEGLRDLAIASWGPLAGAVLESWGVRRTRDFGEMVFLMVSIGLFGRQDSDRIEDFDEVYDFAAAFAEYRIPLEHFDAEHGVAAGERDREA